MLESTTLTSAAAYSSATLLASLGHPHDPVENQKKGIPDEALIIGGVLIGIGLLFGASRKKEEPAKPEPPKAEPPKAEPPKVEPPKAEPPKPEPPKVEPPKVEPPKAQPPKALPPRPTTPSKPRPAAVPVSNGRTFETKGDPVVRTADGLQFSLNRPGVYTSLKSASGDLLMQQKVSTTRDARHYNTALAFQLGKDKLTFDAAEGEKPGTMAINGQAVPLGFKAVAMTLPDGGKLAYDPRKNTITVTTPQGDTLTVHRARNASGVHYLNAKVELSQARADGSVGGVLGTLDAGGEAQDDARMRDGSVYQGPIGQRWRTPVQFLEEWRAREDEALI